MSCALPRSASVLALAALALFVGTSPASAVGKTPDPKQIVLRLADLPVGFALTKGYYADNARGAAESASVTPADYMRWGRITGYEADFSREALIGIISLTSSGSTYRRPGARPRPRTTPSRLPLSDRSSRTARRWCSGRYPWAKIGHEARSSPPPPVASRTCSAAASTGSRDNVTLQRIASAFNPGGF